MKKEDWISIKDKKPVPHKIVLCWCEHLAKSDPITDRMIKHTPGIRFGYYVKEYDQCRVKNHMGLFFEYWMELPDKP